MRKNHDVYSNIQFNVELKKNERRIYTDGCGHIVHYDGQNNGTTILFIKNEKGYTGGSNNDNKQQH